LKWKKYLTLGIIIFITVGSTGTTLGMTETVNREHIESSHLDGRNSTDSKGYECNDHTFSSEEEDKKSPVEENNSLLSDWEVGETKNYNAGSTDILTEGKYFIRIHGGRGEDGSNPTENYIKGDGGNGGYVDGYFMADEGDEIGVTCHEGGNGGFKAGDGGEALTVKLEETKIATAHGGGGGGVYRDYPDSHEFEDVSGGGGGGAIGGSGGEADGADFNYDGENGEEGTSTQNGGDGGASHGCSVDPYVEDGSAGQGEIHSNLVEDYNIVNGGSEASDVEGKVYLTYLTAELKINIEGEGEVDPEEKTHYFDYETEVTIEATPDEHWYFDEWTGDVYGSEEQITVTMDEDKSVTANFEEHEYDLDVTIEGEGSVEIIHDQESYEPETLVTLKADPDEHWYFNEWTGDAYGSEEQITITMDDDKSITANFEEHEYDLDVTIEGEGSVDIDPDQESYDFGTEVTLIAYPDEHWYFNEWTGDASGSKEQITITMDQDKSVTANFEEHEYDLDVTIEGKGSVDIDPDQESYDPGTEVTLIADPDEHWYFNEWTGDTSSSKEQIIITIDQDKSVTANFEEDEYDLDVTIEGEGSVDLDPDQESYDSGTEVTLIADPDEHWYLEKWTGDVYGSEEQITITMDDDKSVTANFEEHEYDLDVTIEGEGSVDIDPNQESYDFGTEVTLIAYPDEHWYLEKWTGDVYGSEKQITITMDDDKSVTANFEEHEYNLDLIVEGNGSVNIEPEKEWYQPEEKVDLTAISEEQWYFKRWTEDASSTEEQITIIMDEDKTITSLFEEHGYNLTVHVEGEGSVDIGPDEKEYEPGTIVNLTAEPEEHYYFEKWSGDHESEDKEINIIIDDNKEIIAHFNKGGAIFYVEIIRHDEEVEIGEQVTVEYRVENTGEVEGAQEIVFRVNNLDIEVVEFPLDPGEEKNKNFSIEAERDLFGEGGEFDLQVLGEDEVDSVTVVVEESSLDSDGKSFLFDYWWILLIIIGSIGVIGFTQVTSKDLNDSSKKGPMLEVGPLEDSNRTKNKKNRDQDERKSIISSEKSSQGASPGEKTTPQTKESIDGELILSDLGQQDDMNNRSVVKSLFKSMERATGRQAYQTLVSEKGDVMDEQEFKDAIQELVKKERLTVQPRRNSEDLYIWKG